MLMLEYYEKFKLITVLTNWTNAKHFYWEEIFTSEWNYLHQSYKPPKHSDLYQTYIFNTFRCLENNKPNNRYISSSKSRTISALSKKQKEIKKSFNISQMNIRK